MSKNYYLILGIASDATSHAIKEAYRKLVKKFHPDHYGENHSRFLDIQEAYSVLSDPEKRYHHDLSSKHQKKPRAQSVKKHENKQGFHKKPEPLIRGHGFFSGKKSPESESLFHSKHDRVSQLLNEIIPDTTFHLNESKAFQIHVSLTRDQAFRGGHIRVFLPVKRECRSCRGQGYPGFYRCRRCMGKGFIHNESPVVIPYPAGIKDHTNITFYLDSHGYRNAALTVTFYIT